VSRTSRTSACPSPFGVLKKTVCRGRPTPEFRRHTERRSSAPGWAVAKTVLVFTRRRRPSLTTGSCPRETGPTSRGANNRIVDHLCELDVGRPRRVMATGQAKCGSAANNSTLSPDSVGMAQRLLGRSWEQARPGPRSDSVRSRFGPITCLVAERVMRRSPPSKSVNAVSSHHGPFEPEALL